MCVGAHGKAVIVFKSNIKMSYVVSDTSISSSIWRVEFGLLFTTEEQPSVTLWSAGNLQAAPCMV